MFASTRKNNLRFQFSAPHTLYYGKSIAENNVTNFLKEYWYGKLMDLDLIQDLLTKSCNIKVAEEDLAKSRRVKRKTLLK